MLIPPRQDYLLWKPLTTALREAEQRLRDQQWEGHDTSASAAEVAYIRQEIDAGHTLVVPF